VDTGVLVHDVGQERDSSAPQSLGNTAIRNDRDDLLVDNVKVEGIE
jgi:hypothetical protein